MTLQAFKYLLISIDLIYATITYYDLFTGLLLVVHYRSGYRAIHPLIVRLYIPCLCAYGTDVSTLHGKQAPG